MRESGLSKTEKMAWIKTENRLNHKKKTPEGVAVRSSLDIINRKRRKKACSNARRPQSKKVGTPLTSEDGQRGRKRNKLMATSPSLTIRFVMRLPLETRRAIRSRRPT